MDAGLPAAARLLLIEDDASIRHFVELALEDEPLELCIAVNVRQALQRLRDEGPFRLILTDLMLPDGNGTDVLQALAEHPHWRCGARVVVFSAGLDADRRRELLGLGVDETLSKPAALSELLQVARRALATAPPAAPATDRTVATPAVDRWFAGDRALFDAYRDACRAQFAVDRRQGDAALAAADWPALRRLAHSLKSVLQTLGHEPEAAIARRLEATATRADAAASAAAWADLGAALDALAASA